MNSSTLKKIILEELKKVLSEGEITAKDKQQAAKVIYDWRNHKKDFEDTAYWTERFEKAEKAFAKTRPTKPIVLYRNERTDIDNKYEHRFTSWSRRPELVERFGWGERRMVWTTVLPESVVVQVSHFGHNIDRDNMEEVIIRPGKYNIEEFPKNAYMIKGLKPPSTYITR